MPRLILVFCTFFCTKMLLSQNGKLVGKVRDTKGNAIIGASVIYRKDITIGATSDEQGNYLMELPAGKCAIVCKYSGMVADTFSVTIIEFQTVTLDLVLVEQVVECLVVRSQA